MCVVGGRCCRCWSRVGTAGLRPLVRRCAWRCPPPCSCYSCISFFPSHSGPIALRTRVCLSCFSYLRALVVAPPVFLLSALTCLRWRAICVSLAYRLRSTLCSSITRYLIHGVCVLLGYPYARRSGHTSSKWPLPPHLPHWL